MNSFSNAMIQRHLGQTETVTPRPIGLYEPIQQPGFEGAEPTEQQIESTVEQPLNTQTEAIRTDLTNLDQAFVSLKPIAMPRQEQAIVQHSDKQVIESTLPVFAPLTTQIRQHSDKQVIESTVPVFEPPTTQIRPKTLPSEINSTPDVPAFKIGHNPDSSDIQPKNTAQIVERHLIQTQAERQTEPKATPGIEQEGASRLVQPVQPQPVFAGQPARDMPGVLKQKVYQTPTTSTIKVSIGRIEVKAVVQAPAQAAKSSAAPKPRLSLEDYLKKQDNHTK